MIYANHYMSFLLCTLFQLSGIHLALLVLF
nr:MAG TPA: hypothetical protein [Caudoviricetes sp.]